MGRCRSVTILIMFYCYCNDVRRSLSQIFPLTGTPVVATVISGVASSVAALVINLDTLIEMMSIGECLTHETKPANVLRPEVVHSSYKRRFYGGGCGGNQVLSTANDLPRGAATAPGTLQLFRLRSADDGPIFNKTAQILFHGFVSHQNHLENPRNVVQQISRNKN